MQKLFIPLLFIIAFITQAKAQQRLFDQSVQLKTCNISIEANSFIATTTIEMEFYNPKDQEVEALQTFQLNRGQVITDFQLELNGKYREGSIEERWKARQAYSSIVGKRIDPALLQMNGQDHYSLNIYPVPAKSSRRIKFTITQMMKAENSKLTYDLPLNFTGSTSAFNLDIQIKNPVSIPYVNKGLLENYFFDMGNSNASVLMQAKDITLNKPVSFSINQFTNEPQICISKHNGKNNFLMRLFPEVPAYYFAKPGAINVYWDVSLSGKERNLTKELNYLEKYITENEIDNTTIFLFNHQLQGTIVFNRLKDNFATIRNYLSNYKYTGATSLGNLNFNNVLADRILLFSDCINSVGSARPKPGAVQVNCIVSNYRYSYNDLYDIIGITGGSVIDLYNTDIKTSVKKTDSAENFLYRFNTAHISLNENFPLKLGKSILLSGTFDQSDNLELIYGNNSSMNKSENYFLSVAENCDEETYKKMRMLKEYDSLMYGDVGYYDWQNKIIFGLTEKVVTPQTSYLVLERIEDYIKYKIAPPKELEEKCAEMNYVYKQEYKIKALKTFTEQDVLEQVVNNYNRRITWWSKDEALIDLTQPVPEKINTSLAANTITGNDKRVSGADMNQVYLKSPPNNLQEVVVTGGYGIRRSLKTTSGNTQVVSSEQLNTIRNTNINEALAGKVAGIQLRGQSGAKLGSSGTIRLHGVNSLGGGTGLLYVLDGTRVAADDINTDDVENVTLLQGPSAAAIFGPDGSNGAMVITSKRARRNYSYNYWHEYKLNSMEDVDYVQEMKKVFSYQLWDTYEELEKENKGNIGFYFEMADFFFEKNMPDRADEAMNNAIELCRGSSYGLKLAAYIYEKWKFFDKAIVIYHGILNADADNLSAKRDLALAYVQNKDFEAAVKTYYSIITNPVSENYWGNIKENALAEMNAVIALRKKEFDISYINPNLLKLLPVDLRVTAETNNNYVSNLQIIEPGNSVCNFIKANTVNGGSLLSKHSFGSIYSIGEYAIKDAVAGNYRVKVNADGYNNYPATIPNYVRIIVFKNFQKENMKIEVKNFDLDNQYGVIELDEVKW